ncbi:MAG: hypothetical protein IJA78_00955 [Clostridia bacterium]|nr:hypothetical protein [Clostridia bacterium]
MKRILCVLLVLVLLLPLLAACKKDPEPAENKPLVIAYDVKTVTFAKVKALALAIQEQTGVAVEVKGRQTGEGELLIGHVESDDVRAALESIKPSNFIMGMFDGSYVITGQSKDATDAALDYFTEHFLPAIGQGSVQLSALGSYHGDGVQKVGEAVFQWDRLAQYSIVLPEAYTSTELRFAVELHQHLLNNIAVNLPIYTQKAAPVGGQIRIGAQACAKATVTETHGYAVCCDEDDLEIAFETGLGYQGARAVLTETVLSKEAALTGGALAVNAAWHGNGEAFATAGLEADGDLRMMFSNIWGVNTYSGKSTPMAPRTEMLVDLYLTYMPDVLGFQEYKPAVDATGLIERLVDAGYKRVVMPAGAATDNGSDATSMVYNPATVELLQRGYFRFDDLTYNEYPSLLGGRSAATVKNRCADSSKGFDWAILRKRGTGEVFLVASVHLWYANVSYTDPTNLDVVARKIQIQAMKDELARAAADFAAAKGLSAETLPIFVGGDYNSKTISGSPLHQMTAITDIGGVNSTFVDTNAVAAAKLTSATWHSTPGFVKGWEIEGIFTELPNLGVFWNMSSGNNPYSQALDHIFLNVAGQSMVSVNRMGMLRDEYAYLSSDHNPVYVDVTFEASCPIYMGTV